MFSSRKKSAPVRKDAQTWRGTTLIASQSDNGICRERLLASALQLREDFSSAAGSPRTDAETLLAMALLRILIPVIAF